MTRNIDTALLRAFVAIAETGSVTRAAKALNLTQAAVSQQLKRLEEQFGQTLFTRERRALEITQAGEQVLTRARRMLAMNDDLWNLMSAPEYEGEIRFGMPHDILGVVAPPLLARFDAKWPRVRVDLLSSTSPKLREALANGDLDLTLTTESQPGEGGEVLLEDPLVWAGAVGGRAYSRRPLPVSFGEVSCAFRRPATEALDRLGMNWRVACETAAVEAMVAVVRADLAVIPYLRSSIPEGMEELGPEAGLPRLPTFNIILYRRAGQGTAMLDDLVEEVRREFSCYQPNRLAGTAA